MDSILWHIAARLMTLNTHAHQCFAMLHQHKPTELVKGTGTQVHRDVSIERLPGHLGNICQSV